jgi:ketosteroid isomerase-like protein
MDTESIVRRVVDAYNSDDPEAEIEELWDPNCEFVPVRAALEDTVYRGHDGIRRFNRDNQDSWAENRVEILKLEVSGEQAVMLTRIRAKGRASGASTDQTFAWGVSLRNGRVMRLASHRTVEDARQQLGWDA